MKQFLLLFLLLMIGACNKDMANDINPMGKLVETLGSSTQTWNEEYIELVNAHRKDMGLEAFINSKDIETIAYKHAQDMAAGIVAFGHAGSSIRCSQIKLILGGGNLCGEIVARGQKTPAEVFKAWMASPLHREKLESGRYNHTGLGFTKSSDGKTYWTQIFLER